MSLPLGQPIPEKAPPEKASGYTQKSASRGETLGVGGADPGSDTAAPIANLLI